MRRLLIADSYETQLNSKFINWGLIDTFIDKAPMTVSFVYSQLFYIYLNIPI